MKTKIIAADPGVIEDGADRLGKHCRWVLDQCSGKKTALLFINSPAEAIRATLIKNGLDSEFWGDDGDTIDLTAELYEDLLEDSDYWCTLARIFGNSLVLDFTPAIERACYLDARANANESLFKRNFFRAKADFMRTFGDASVLHQAVLAHGIEVLITDFGVGYNLYKSARRDFAFHTDLSANDKEPLREGYQEMIEEAGLLMQVDEHSKPDIVGTWDVYDEDKGRFGLYFLPESALGAVEGIISDRYGLARFSGEMTRHSLEFRKSYFAETLNRDCLGDVRLSVEPVHYVLRPSAGDGEYWWDSDANKKTSCLCRATRKLYQR